ncbi:MAG TPA: hypothetical protein VJB34_05345 [Bdellovibrionota bacterium]|nr:hypothetical protein [Bdellovibrionota bacterium]
MSSNKEEREVYMKTPSTAEKITEWQVQESSNKVEILIQFLIETGIIDPLDWKAYLAEQKKIS